MDTGAKELPRPLADYGLSENYYSLSPAKRKEARKVVLTSWFDTKRPHILCTDLEAFMRAFRLWVDHYLKRSKACAHWYHYGDPKHKEEMVRLAMSPPIVPSLPSKLVEIAPRGTGKTFALFIELFSMVAICRPKTDLVMSQANAVLTIDKFSILRSMLEDNEVIQEDFGGEGHIWPKHRMRKSWNTKRLDFIDSGSCIVGKSIGSKQRGGRFHLGLVDDADDGISSLNPEWRRSFFNWLLGVYCPMFGRGGHIIFMQTATNGLTPAYQMIHSQSKNENIDWNVVSTSTNKQLVDTNFFDWRKKIWALHTEDPVSGTWVSLWEDKYPAAERKQLEASLTTPVYMAEMQGQPISGSVFIFQRKLINNSFMICNDYAIDFPTNRRWPLREFMARQYIVTAADPATDAGIDKCYSAAVTVGIDPEGVLFVLDAFIEHCEPEDLVEMVMWKMSVDWGSRQAVFEKHGLQILLIKSASEEAKKMRARGLEPPELRGITSQNVLQSENLTVGRGQQKIARIMGTLKPAINPGRMRFREFGEVVGPDGVRHVARYDEREAFHAALKDQIDSFTDRGGRVKIDGVDALEMATRVLWNIRGDEVPDNLDPNEAEIKEWQKVGVAWGPSALPPQAWTREMREQFRTRRHEMIGATPLDGSDTVVDDSVEFNPYGLYG